MAKQNFGFHFCIRGSAHGRNDPRRLERNLLCEISPTSGGYRLNTGPTQPEGHNLRRLHAAVHVARVSLNTGRRFWVALFLSVGLSVSTFDASAVADPNALWNIVHGECVPHMEAGLGPKPCERVDLAGGVAEGVAILKDLVGVSQMLAIPTRRITGIEDPQMLAPDAPPVFADAWGAKDLVEARLGRALPREAVGLAINSKWARSQEQLHVHVDCAAVPVVKALAEYASALDDQWRAMTVPLRGRVYFARRVDSADLRDVAPLKLLADGLEGARTQMGAYSLAAIGATFDERPGFILLADEFSLEGGGHAEDLQDHDCAIAHSAP
jgi:CDP-diacylglycerol pyrophosphatase